METKNLFSNLSTNQSQELVEILAENQHVRVERIVSYGHKSPDGFWYDQEEHELVVVIQGEARLRFEHEEENLHLKSGDHVLIPAHQKHRVEWTTPDQPTIWLAVFFGSDTLSARKTRDSPKGE